MRRTAGVLAVAAAALQGVAILIARQDPPLPKALIPASANSILESPDTYYGQVVTVTAAVERVVSSNSFTVDQDPRRSAPALLVIAPVLTEPIAVNAYLTIIGEVVRHEQAPAIQATSVLTAAGTDLAKRPPPPMTPEEEAFDKVMKAIGPAFNSLRQAIGSSGSETAAADAQVLQEGFARTEVFWKQRGRADAATWAAEARTHSETLRRAVVSGRWDDAKTAASALQQTCASCHGAYRQRLDDGSYRIRGMDDARED